MKRPGLGEFDCGSYLDGSLLEHDVQCVLPAGVVFAAAAPSFRTEALVAADVMCQACSFRLAQEHGYGPPETLVVAYDGAPDDPEEVLCLRAADGSLLSIATYSYGRAYFEPGEARTARCGSCGAETLVSASGYDTVHES